MTTLTNWLSPSALHSLGWTLLHFLWQGTAVAALAAVLMTLCRRASARYVLAVGALVLMLAAPVATFFVLTASVGASSMNSPVAEELPTVAHNIVTRPASGFSRLSPSLDTLPWLVEAWLLGVAFFSLRSAGGFLLLERERRRQSDTVSARVLETCQTLQRKLGLNRAVRYCECAWLQAPAVIGWFRPVVLLPVTALTGLSEEQLQLVIVHELAHIQRLDLFVNVFQVSVETLFFYHPAVWWLNKRIRAEREHCCDDVAVSLCGNPVEYARALTLMEEWRTAPVLAMAANRGPLSERIFRVLGLKSIGAGNRGIGLTGGLLCLTAALVAGNALLGIAYPKPIVHASQISFAHFAGAAPEAPQSSAAPVVAPAPAAKPSPVRPQAVEPKLASGGSYIDGMKAAGVGEVTVDQLIAMKIQGVTPEYVRGLHEQGFHSSADELIGMRIQGVTPEYIREIRTLGLNPNADQIMAMRIQGVDASYVRGLKDAGIQPGVDQLIAMRIQGVTPDYVRGLHEQGLQPNVDELVGMRIQGVTPEYIRDIRALGLKPSAEQFVAMRIQGVTPEYIKGLQGAGFKFGVDDVIGARIQGITPEFIERARKHGFQNLSLEKLIHLKQAGILDSPTDL
ncbi:MAG TPA: M56 family metallopeptidase [Candidatus Acidoferrum sp.]|jgi:beta-lactamase regulating signal transducer with metallopeptidase domain|nr:M56 family metallopeptidase [Candidatus Acidoferrum sp.]